MCYTVGLNHICLDLKSIIKIFPPQIWRQSRMYMVSHNVSQYDNGVRCKNTYCCAPLAPNTFCVSSTPTYSTCMYVSNNSTPLISYPPSPFPPCSLSTSPSLSLHHYSSISIPTPNFPFLPCLLRKSRHRRTFQNLPRPCSSLTLS